MAPDCAPAREADRVRGPLEFAHAGGRRSYLLALPDGYDGSRAVPVVFDFHGHGGSKEQQDANTSMSERGTARGFVVVTPDALGEPRAWNAFGDPARPDDFGFMYALLEDLSERLCIDAERVYAAGHSNGSAFTAFLACQGRRSFAAIAMVSATTPGSCVGDAAFSVIAIAGTADPIVPYEGGAVGGSAIAIPPVAAVIEGYVGGYGCEAMPAVSEPATGVVRDRYAGCSAGVEVILDTVAGGGHAWPGGLQASADPANSEAGKNYDATDAILDFFEQDADRAR